MKFYGSVLFAFFFVANAEFASAASVDISVTLSPAGKFTATTGKVTGQAIRNGDSFTAKDIKVDVASLKTGIALRDDHLKKRLDSQKFPVATLIKAEGSNGKGTAVLSIKGKKLKVNGEYKVKGDNIVASFPIHLPDLGISDVRYMGVGVKDQVTVNVELPIAVKARTPAANAKKKK